MEEIPPAWFRLVPLVAESLMQPISSVQSCPAADLPCKQITHSCLALGVKVTARESSEVQRE